MVITNNPMVARSITDGKQLVYLQDGTYTDVLITARDKIHLGHALLTHPLSGSVKPGQTPYKTVIVADRVCELDFESLNLIEESISTAKKLTRNGGDDLHNIKIKLLEDFQLIDFSLIQGGV